MTAAFATAPVGAGQAPLSTVLGVYLAIFRSVELNSLRESISVRIALLLALCLFFAGCVSSPAGPVYTKSKGKGPEREMTGVVNGIYRYNQSENRDRLEKLLDIEDQQELDSLSSLYQVRVGFDRGILFGKSVDVALLPKGWIHTTKPNADNQQTIQPGDVVLVSTQRGRLVDYVVSIKRRCDSPRPEGEKRELAIGCFEIQKFGKSGYGGKKYYFSAF